MCIAFIQFHWNYFKKRHWYNDKKQHYEALGNVTKVWGNVLILIGFKNSMWPIGNFSVTIALSVSKEEDMDVKECIVCGNGFEFKNNSKKTCSDKCRKQLSRNKKKKRTRLIENQNVTAIQNHYKAEFESMVVELYCMAFDKILSFLV